MASTTVSLREMEGWWGTAEAYHAKQVELLERVTAACEKLAVVGANAELRQTMMFGEGTDGIRLFETWAIGENAVATQVQVRMLTQDICRERTTRCLAYNFKFHEKDKRRSEWFAENFVRTFVKGKNEGVHCEDHADVGARAVSLPSVRKLLLAEHRYLQRTDPHALGGVSHKEFRGMFPCCETALRLQALILPIDKGYKAVRVAEHAEAIKARLVIDEGHDEPIEVTYASFDEIFAKLPLEIRTFLAEALVGMRWGVGGVGGFLTTFEISGNN